MDLTEETIKIYDKDDDYVTTLVNAIFNVTGNCILKPCTCKSMNEDFVGMNTIYLLPESILSEFPIALISIFFP